MCDLQNLPFQTLIFNAISGSWFCNIHYDSIDLNVRILEGIFFWTMVNFTFSFILSKFFFIGEFIVIRKTTENVLKEDSS